jgi:CheY-like chemotaxis protein
MIKRLRAILFLLIFAVLAPQLVTRSVAQERFDFDLLDEASEAEVAEPAAMDSPSSAAPAPRTSVVESAVIEAIRQADPRTPSELLRAVDQLVRLERADVAAEYLDRLVKLALDDASLAPLYEQFGTATMIRLARTAELAPQASDFAVSVMQAGRRVLQDPDRLNHWADALGGPNEAERFRAAEQLLRAGPHSVPALIDSIASQDDATSASSRRSWEVLRRLGPTALEPIHAYLWAHDSPGRATAITALGVTGSTDSLPYLVAPLFAGQNDDRAMQRAADAWRRILGRAPDYQQAVELLSVEANHAYQGQSGLAPDPDDMVTRWTWNAERQQPVASRMRARDAAAVKASRLYEDLLRVKPDDTQAAERYLISRLAVDQAMGGLDEPLRRGAGTAFDVARRAGSAWMNRVLQRAIDDQRDEAAIGGAEVLGSFAAASVFERSTIDSGVSSIPLVEALSHPDRRVRFAAAQAMMALKPEGSLHGAGRLADVLNHFATSDGSRAAVVAHPNPTTARSLAAMLTSRGFRTAAVSTVRDLEAAATSSADVELVMVSDMLNDASLWSTLEALRVHPHTARVPIAILARSTGRDNALRVAGRHQRTMVLNETADEAAIDLHLPQLLKLADRDTITPQRRSEQAQLAKAMLDELRSNGAARE